MFSVTTEISFMQTSDLSYKGIGMNTEHDKNAVSESLQIPDLGWDPVRL